MLWQIEIQHIVGLNHVAKAFGVKPKTTVNAKKNRRENTQIRNQKVESIYNKLNKRDNPKRNKQQQQQRIKLTLRIEGSGSGH